MIIGFGLLCIVALLYVVNISNPAMFCTRDLLNSCGDSGQNWMRLVDIEVPLSISDIVYLISNSLIILLSVLSFIVVCNGKTIMTYERVMNLLFASEVVLMLFFGYALVIQINAPNRFAPGSADISSKIRIQLKDSLHYYSEGEDVIMNNAWEGTMKDGCCCGVDGYTDFLDIDAEIPEYCTCTSNMTNNSSTPRCYNPRLECERKTKYNVTTKGCYNFIIDKLQSYQKRIHQLKFLIFILVSAMQSTSHLTLTSISLTYYRAFTLSTHSREQQMVFFSYNYVSTILMFLLIMSGAFIFLRENYEI